MEKLIMYHGYAITTFTTSNDCQVRFNNGFTQVCKSLHAAKIWITKHCL